MIHNNKKCSSSTLILYFSVFGTTKTAANKLSNKIKAPVIEIIPEKPYPKNYDLTVKMAREQLNKQIHPKIKHNIKNINIYDTIYIGYPTWWQQPPLIIHSLFDEFDFDGKTIIPFTTSMSTPISESQPIINELAELNHAKVKTGFRYTGLNSLNNQS